MMRRFSDPCLNSERAAKMIYIEPVESSKIRTESRSPSDSPRMPSSPTGSCSSIESDLQTVSSRESNVSGGSPTEEIKASQEPEGSMELPPILRKDLDVEYKKQDELVSLPRIPAHHRSRYSPSESRSQCHLCGKMFSRARDINRHVGSVHFKGKSCYDCRACARTFTRLDSLKRHVNKTCNPTRSYTC